MKEIQIYLSLGSNLGDRQANLNDALDALEELLEEHIKEFLRSIRQSPGDLRQSRISSIWL